MFYKIPNDTRFIKLQNQEKKEQLKKIPQKNEFKKILKGFHKSTPAQQDKKLKDAAEQWESEFVYLLLKQMRRTVNKQGFINGGYAEEIFQDMLDRQYSISAAENYDFGIAKQLYEQMVSTVKLR